MLTKLIKWLFVGGILLCAATWISAGRTSEAVSRETDEPRPAVAAAGDAGYIGSDGCKDCHEDQFKAFSHTSHGQLTKISSWNGKVTGCEACHGPGKAHVEEGDPKKIISFKNKPAKEISETF